MFFNTISVCSKLREQLHKMEYTPTEEKRLRLEVENLQKAKESLKYSLLIIYGGTVIFLKIILQRIFESQASH